MADTQDEKFTKEEGVLRDEINAAIEAAYPGKKINEIIELKIKTKRGTYYKNVKKRPLSRRFIEMIKTEIGVDISIFNDTKNNTLVDISKDELVRENIVLHRKLNEYLEKGNKDKDKIIELLEQIDRLKDMLKDAG